jgi:beta-glucosidase
LGDEVRVSVQVKNTGDRDGQEVVQLYIRDEIASRARPIKLMRGFKKVGLKAGEAQQVEFNLGSPDFGFYDAEGNLLLEPGRFQIMVGPNSEDLKSVALTLS